jgi:outer membrane lipoprotein-sorting protein
MTQAWRCRGYCDINGVHVAKRGVNVVSTVARVRWAVPAGAVAVVGIVVGTTAATAAAAPSLPRRTAAQLLADVAKAANQPAGPYTATVEQTANLGLPQLPALPQSDNTSVLTSGTQSINIWYADPQHLRVAVPVQAGESDARLDGRTLWLWNSENQAATKLTLPATTTGAASKQRNGAAGASGPSSVASPVPVTPQAAASQLLRAIGPSTAVAVQSPVYVASRPAYQLSLTPNSSQSLVGRVLIAIDASRDIPLRVEVYGRGGAGPAYSVGFTALSFGSPAASNFSFTPPPGATVTKEAVPANPGALLKGLGLPSGAQAATRSGTGKPIVIGAGWLSVAATPSNPQVAAAVHQLLTDHAAGTSSNGSAGGSQSVFVWSSSSAAPARSGSASSVVPVGPYLAPLQALLLASRAVSGNWGSGRLLQTTLASVLVTSMGQILVGAVSPSVLYADVAKDAG